MQQQNASLHTYLTPPKYIRIAACNRPTPARRFITRPRYMKHKLSGCTARGTYLLSKYSALEK